MKKIYLAGPDVFRANPIEHFNELKRIAKNYKIEALSPFDNESDGSSAKQIFEANIKLLNEVDAVIANLVPFRGASIDDGTAFEIGYAYSRKIKILGYTSTFNQSLLNRTKSNPNFQDTLFPIIENFNHPCNLMIAESIIETGGVICSTYEECLGVLSGRIIKF